MPFLDKRLSGKIPGVGWVSSPRTNTSIQVNAAGGEHRNQNWEHPLHHFTLPEGIRDWEQVDALKDFWLIMRGPYRSWPQRDPSDFASCKLDRPNRVPAVAMTDQVIGTGDGFTQAFQLAKTYRVEDESYVRSIYLPVLASVVVANNGALVSSSDYSVSRPGGVVTFNTPPLAGHVITAGFLFDCEVRFESDDQLEQILRAKHVAGFADLTLTEVRPC